MTKYILRLLIFSILIFGISELPVRSGYITFKLADTQYEKLLWLEHQFKSGKLNNQHYDIAVFGSSSSLYGFNDSATTSKAINLGVNTGNRSLELYLLEQFIKYGNSANFFIKEFHSLDYRYFDHYGLHKVLHYLVKPSWLLARGQSIIQPHFILFVINRFKTVIHSWVFFHLQKNYDAGLTDFGYRPKLKTISEHKYDDIINSSGPDIAGNNLNPGKFSDWRFNFSSSRRFRHNFDTIIAQKYKQKAIYVFMPTLIRGFANNTQLNNTLKKMEKDFSIEIIPCPIDSSFYFNRFNWADAGHYSQLGAITFTRAVESEILPGQ